MIIGAFFVFSHLIFRPESPDERGYLAWGMRIYREGAYETPDGRPVTKVPPLHPHLLALGFRLFGTSVESAQCTSAIFGALCVGIVYAMGRSQFNWRVGLLAALLLMTSAKGEFWRYSNRVLNDIHLTLFILMTLYLICLHWRYGKWWVGAGAGISLGLGLLTKELAVLVLPLFILAFLFRQDPLRKKLVALFISLSLAACLILPWALHVKNVTGSPIGGVAQRGKGQAFEAISLKEGWGLRDWKEIWETLHFRGMTSGPFKGLYTFSLLYVAYRFWRRREREGLLLILLVLTWFTVFLTSLKLPLTRRQLIPLIPIYSLFVAILLDDLYTCCKRVIERRGRLDERWVKYGALGLLLILLAVNLKPGRWVLDIYPFHLLDSSIPPFIYAEAQEARKCLAPGAKIISNYPNLFYFYGEGQFEVFKSKWISKGNKGRRSEAGIVRSRIGKGTTIADHMKEEMIDFLTVVHNAPISHVVLLRPNDRWQSFMESLGRAGVLPWEVACQGEGVMVYRLLRHDR